MAVTKIKLRRTSKQPSALSSELLSYGEPLYMISKNYLSIGDGTNTADQTKVVKLVSQSIADNSVYYNSSNELTDDEGNLLAIDAASISFSGTSLSDVLNTKQDVITTLSASNGGTGLSSVPVGEVLVGNGTSAMTTKAIDTVATLNSSNLITSGAVYNIANGKEPAITTLPVSKGGTGKNTLDSGKVLVGNGTSAVSLKSIDSSPTSSSSNLITSGGVYTALTNKLNTTSPSVGTNLANVTSANDCRVYFANPTGSTNAEARFGYNDSLKYNPSTKVFKVGSPAVTTASVREIYCGTADLTPGVSQLATGTIYMMYV